MLSKRLQNWCVLPVFMATSLALAGDLPQQFSLGRYIPGNCWLYTSFVENPENAWLEKEWGKVFEEVERLNLSREAVSLVSTFLPEEEGDSGRADLAKLAGLFEGVAWRDLIAKELALAERIAAGKSMPEYVVLLRPASATLESNWTGLRAIFSELAKYSDKVTLVPKKVGDVDLLWLVIGDPLSSRGEFSRLALLRRGPVFGFVFGEKMGAEVVALLAGRSESVPLTRQPRFRKAVAELPAPEDFLFFADVRGLLGNINSALRSELSRKGKEGAAVADIFARVFGKLDIIDYSVMTTVTKDRRQTTEGITRIQRGKERSAVARIFSDRRSMSDVHRIIPEDATGFYASSMLNVDRLYEFITSLVRDDIPGGAGAIAKWHAWLAKVDFDPQRDIFDWLSGEVVTVSLPPSENAALPSDSWVVFLHVKDPVLAAKKVNAAIDIAGASLREHGQMLLVRDRCGGMEGFRELTHPMLAFLCRPVVGVSGEWLIVGSCPDSVQKCLAVSEGRAPSFFKAKRFLSEGLLPEGPVYSLSFADRTNFGDELSQGAVALSIGGATGLMAAQRGVDISGKGKNEEAKKLLASIQRIFALSGKLAPALKKIDFYRSTASKTTFDGKAWRSTTVVTYQTPKRDQHRPSRKSPTH